jgi:hypothetical protein
MGLNLLVVTPHNRVEARRVVPGPPSGRDLVVSQGLEAGERVVTDGQLRLTPGARVDAKAAPPEVRPGGTGAAAPAGAPTPTPATKTGG